MRSGRGREAQRRGETAGGGGNDGILSELNCGVNSCDGSVNSNKSHMVLFGLWTKRGACGHRSRLEEVLRDENLFVHIYI